METLIELYDDRAIENVIAPEVFRPKKVVYLAPVEIAQDRTARDTVVNFLRSRGLTEMTVEFLGVSLFKADRILQQLRSIVEKNRGCAMDVGGGTDAALIAAGMLCSETDVPTFTYSRKKNRFYDISHAPFADELPCELSYTVDDFFRMTGGSLRKGRVDNSLLPGYAHTFDAFFKVFLQYRRGWSDRIMFLQRISQGPKDIDGRPVSLKVSGGWVQKGERGGRITADTDFLTALSELGYIKNLSWVQEVSVAFEFTDELTRSWLRDVGSVLELYMYEACRRAGIFREVVSSAIVDWDGTVGHDSVSNEIDVAASAGIIPMFISCKACEVKTEAINELAILAERFGGKGSKAAIATTEPISAAARHRAAQLGIAIIDLEELSAGRAADRIRVIMKADEYLK